MPRAGDAGQAPETLTVSGPSSRRFGGRGRQTSRQAPLGFEARVLATLALTCMSTISIMILPQVHLRKPCYDFYFL